MTPRQLLRFYGIYAALRNHPIRDPAHKMIGLLDLALVAQTAPVRHVGAQRPAQMHKLGAAYHGDLLSASVRHAPRGTLQCRPDCRTQRISSTSCWHRREAEAQAKHTRFKSLGAVADPWRTLAPGRCCLFDLCCFVDAFGSVRTHDSLC